MAEVRDAWDTRLDRPVAIKILHPAMNARPESLNRFRDEARSAAMLAHPSIIAVHDYGEQDGTPFIVIERLPGRNLHDVVVHGPMPPDQVRSMLDDVLAALSVAHSAGVLHRDIKPADILLSVAGGGSVNVADFGSAKAGWGRPHHDRSGHRHDGLYESRARRRGSGVGGRRSLCSGRCGLRGDRGPPRIPQDTRRDGARHHGRPAAPAA